VGSCAPDEYRDYLYDMPGFDPGTRPRQFTTQTSYGEGLRFKEFYNEGENIDESNFSRQVESDRYRQQYINAPVKNYNSQNIQGSRVPNSRFYDNPYDIPDPNFYPTQDIDRYYVPPPYYQNIERSYSVPTTPNPRFEQY